MRQGTRRPAIRQGSKTDGARIQQLEETVEEQQLLIDSLLAIFQRNADWHMDFNQEVSIQRQRRTRRAA